MHERHTNQDSWTENQKANRDVRKKMKDANVWIDEHSNKNDKGMTTCSSKKAFSILKTHIED